MKRWLVILAGGLFVLVGVALLWLRNDAGREDRVPEDRPGSRNALPVFEAVPIASSTPSPLAVTGIVRDAFGRPIAGAEVAIAASAQRSLANARCDVCGAPLLSCSFQTSIWTVKTLLETQHGHLMAGATALTDAGGRFRFENLNGVSFTVWAVAEGYGTAVHERAAPGDPVELFLPPLRALAGVVVDEEGAPVADARVYVLSRRVAIPVETWTRPDGGFEATGLGEGPFYVLVDAPGFLPTVAHQVEAGPQPVRIGLWRPRALEVEVRSNGELTDALVTVAADHLERSAEAPGGYARLTGLAPGEITVTAVAGELAAPILHVDLFEPSTRVRLDLGAAGRLAVTVIDEQGQPVTDPTIYLARAGSTEVLIERRAKTGELVLLGPVVQGSYVLVGEAGGYSTVDLPVEVRGGESRVELVLARGTTIRGRVLDMYGRPAPGVSVLVNPLGTSVRADEQGRFSATVPSPGLYELLAHHSDWGGAEVRVTAPADGVELNLEPKAGARVTVTLEGQRIEGADVVLWLDRTTSWRSDRPSGADGVVFMRGMPPGTYTAVASHRDHLPSEPATVTLLDGALTELTLALVLGESIRGTVVDELGAPVPGALVHATPRGPPPATTDASGAFVIRPVRPQTSFPLVVKHEGYDQKERVQGTAGGEPVTIVMTKRGVFRGRVLSEDGEPLRLFRIAEREVVSSDGTFELPLPTEEGRVYAHVEAAGYRPAVIDRPADIPDVGDIRLSKDPEMSGTVLDEHGQPVEGAVVTCTACDEQVTTGPDGRFSLTVPGSYGGYELVATHGLRRGSAPPSWSGVEIILRTAASLSGRAYLPDGRPAAGVQVEIVRTHDTEGFSAVTMPDGTWRLDVPEGSYRFTIAGVDRVYAGDPALYTTVRGGPMQVDLGPAPGTSTLRVAVPPGRAKHALFLVRGPVGPGSWPPGLVEQGWVMMAYEPRGGEVTFRGIPPGQYTLVWGRFHTSLGPDAILRPVTIPGTDQVSLLPAQP